MSEKKVIFITHEGALSGANICLLEYIQILYRHGFQLYLISPRFGDLTEAATPYLVRSYEIYYYGWTVRKNSRPSWINRLRVLLRNQIARKQIGKIIRSVRPDYICTNTITVNIGALVARNYHVPHIWFVHEFGELDHGFTFARGMRYARERILALSKKVAVNSHVVFQSFPQSDKLFVVHNPVLEYKYIAKEPGKNKELNLLMLGQIAEAKNQKEAVEAMRILLKQELNVHLNIYGNIVNKAYADSLVQLIDQFNLNSFVKIHPATHDIQLLFNKHDALLMCSRMEAFGRVTVEALKSGLPVIGADTGGTLEIIEDGVNGYLYKAGDAPDLAEKIKMLENNYSRFDTEKISSDAMAKYNESNTWEQLKVVFDVT